MGFLYEVTAYLLRKKSSDKVVTAWLKVIVDADALRLKKAAKGDVVFDTAAITRPPLKERL